MGLEHRFGSCLVKSTISLQVVEEVNNVEELSRMYFNT